jgi:hypothetical protein
MKLKDHIAIFLMRLIFKMGYHIYVRKFVDDHRINENDIGIYESEHFRVMAICTGALHRERQIDEMDFEFVGKN